MFDYLLPVGSVVLLKEGTKPLMIFGIKQIDPETPGKDYDYVSVPYPEGHIGIQTQFLFNHVDIEKVLFRGFEDEVRSAFIEALNKLAKERENAK